MGEKLGPGPTGDFSDGKLQEGDEGGINLTIAACKGRVLLEFGCSVQWLGFEVHQAREVAEALLKQAANAEDQLRVEVQQCLRN
jgi:hypothetical protein